MDTAGNAANSLGTREACNSIAAVGDLLEIDVTVKGVPPYVGSAGGLGGFGFDFIYDPAVVTVAAADAAMMLTADGTAPILLSFSDSAPDNDGDFRLDIVELSGTAESGDGVLIRISLQAVGSGVGVLHVQDTFNQYGDGLPLIADNVGNRYAVGSVLDGEVVVGATCGDTDADGWTTSDEAFVGTDPVDPCADDALDAAWPPDFDNNTSVNIIDALHFGPVISSRPGDDQYDQRFNLDAAGYINVIDVLMLGPVIMQSCANP